MRTGANAAGLDPRDESNWRCCEAADGKCINPPPSCPPLNDAFADAFELFQHMLPQMQFDGMTGQRRTVPTADIEAEARIRWIGLDEITLDGFRTLEMALATSGADEEE